MRYPCLLRREQPNGQRILIASRAGLQVLSACLSTRLSIQAARKPCQINTRKSRIAASLAFDLQITLSHDVGNRSLRYCDEDTCELNRKL